MAGSSNDVQLPYVEVLRQYARDQLVLNLEAVSGRKDLVLDPELMKPLDRVAGATLLKQHGVDKIFKLELSKPLIGCEKRIYLVRPRVRLMRSIADQINAEKNAGHKRSYTILMVPRKLHVCERVLEQEGVFGYVSIDEYQLDLIPLDKDVLSLELPEFFRSYFLDGDQTWCHTAARALLNLQQVFGLIPNVYGIGRSAQIVHEMTDVLFELEGEPKQLNHEIGSVFLIDRAADLVTPLCSQVTYEGLLDDTFGIHSGFIEFGSEVTGKDQSVKLLLSSTDEVYEEIRNRHFSNVFSFLSGKAKELQVGYDKRHMLTSVQEMKTFVANDLRGLKQQHKSLTLHIGACEVILNQKTTGNFEDQLRTEHGLLEGVDSKENINYIEEMINRQYDETQCLRLLCLLSLTQGGLQPQVFKGLKKQFLQSFGFEKLVGLHNLKKMGMFTEQETAAANRQLAKVAAHLPKSSPFRTLCRKLGLIPKSAEEINLKNVSEMSYVFSGAYTPVLCKLVEQVLTKGSFKGLEDVVKLLPGPCFEKNRATSVKGKSSGGSSSNSPASRVVLVYFIGGCTFTEITALRFLGRLKGYKFIIATTAIVNATSLIREVVDP